MIRVLIIGVVLIVLTGGCRTTAVPDGPRARNVILLIGDGLGTTQMALGLSYARFVEGRTLHMARLMEGGQTGYSMPLPSGAVVTDSASAASQMATGRPVRVEAVALDTEGYPLETILEWAEGRGLATGLVTNMRLSHATPASFAAHQGSRYDPEGDVLGQILSQHDIDVLLGGGARALVPQGTRVSDALPGLPPELDEQSNRTDDRDLIAEARQRGYAVASNREELRAAAPLAERLLGLFSANHLPYVVDTRGMELTGVPSLAELTGSALTVLERAGNGFFLMVEGGRIDYAGHDNDAGTMLLEIFDFDEAVGAALEFQERHPDTLIIVTADHGTGGVSLTYGNWDEPFQQTLPSGAVYRPDHFYPGEAELRKLGAQTASYERMRELAGDDPARLVEVVAEHTGLAMTIEEAESVLRVDADGRARTDDFTEFYTDASDTPDCLLGRALARHTFVVWSTGGHTIEPVMTFGTGPGSDGLRGLYDNTRIYETIQDALGAGTR